MKVRIKPKIFYIIQFIGNTEPPSDLITTIEL